MSILPARDGLPPMGHPGCSDPNGGERRCSRTINGIVGPGEKLCNRQGATHIIWEDTPEGVETSWACEEHTPEIRERWRPLATHPAGPCCGMPGARYSFDDNVCFYEDGLPTTEPVRAVAEPVPVAAMTEEGRGDD